MAVLKKLSDARFMLSNKGIRGSGANTFAKYTYLELSDFLPEIHRIFRDLGLCGVVSIFGEEAKLVISDVEDGSSVEFLSDKVSVELKGSHPIQNIGAMQTYLRRYLWIMALEIAESDAVDSGLKPATVSNTVSSKPELTPAQKNRWANAKKAFLRDKNLDAVLAVFDMTDYNQQLLIAEAQGIDAETGEVAQ